VDLALESSAARSNGDRRMANRQLVADGVCKYFGGLRAVEDVSLAINQGEILGLIGPNGSGKTTFINVITGHLEATRGRVHLGEVDVTGSPPHRLPHVGIARTFQVTRLFKQLTVLENVEAAAVTVGQSSRSQAREMAMTALARVGLAERSNLQSRTLPHGEGRLLEVARALGTNPSFLLLDEPGAGLNDAESHILLETLMRIRAEVGCGLLVVDHDMRLIMRLCDRIHVLDHGRTIAEGTPEVVRRLPAVREAYLGSTADA
jgi:ABC-type branched-subunit amino acid transport system ATPase component